jgi:uncharacterized protein (TIGR02145 family)
MKPSKRNGDCMNYLKGLCALTIVIFITALILCTNNPTEPDNNSNQITHKGLYGKLVDKEGKVVFGAKVKAINATRVMQNSNSAHIISATGGDSVTTDSSGYYTFESLVAGTYNLQGNYSDGKLVVLITNIIYDSAGAIKEVKTDTLRAPGQISGNVNTNTEDNGGVLCYVPGTSYLSMTDDTGGFSLLNIPQGNYKVTYRKEGLKTVSDTGIEVRSGERTKLPVKNMEADPAYPPPAPADLSVTYDTLHGCAVLKWKPVIVSDLAGYVIYRNDTSLTTPLQISKSLVVDTMYIDTVYHNLMDTIDQAFLYRNKAQDKDANLSTVYSKPFTIRTPSPTKVRTFFSWKYINTIADSASVSDTVSIIVAYHNATRKNIKLSWYINDKDSLFTTVNDSSLIGSDTIKYAWRVPIKPKIYVSMLDKANSTWWDSTTINIVQDVPQIVFVTKDTVVEHGGSVRCSVYVRQQFGTMNVEIDTANSGNFISIGNVGLTGGQAYSFTTSNCSSWDSVKIKITDDDGNVVLQGFKVDIRPEPLTITSIDSSVNTISMNYSVSEETDFSEYSIYRDIDSSVDITSTLWSSSTDKGKFSQTSSDEKYQYTTYCYCLYQKDSEGLWSLGSNIVKARIKNSPPTIPVITYPVNDGDSIWSDAVLRWKCADPNGHSMKYGILINHNNSGYVQFASDLTDTLKQLLGYDSLEIKFKVIAYDSEGDSSDWSEERLVQLKTKITDVDGNVYNVVKIGTQFWMVENLTTTRYNDGTVIPLVTDNAAWAVLATPGYCFYNNTTNVDSIKKFGALYNWYVVNPANPKKIAPAGWHVPTDAEFGTLQDFLIANGYNWDGTTTGNKIAKSMAAKTDWKTYSTPGAIGNDLTMNNSTGFSALPGGYRIYNGIFDAIGSYGSWRSATEQGATNAHYCCLYYDQGSFTRTLNNNRCGYSVKLLRDSD